MVPADHMKRLPSFTEDDVTEQQQPHGFFACWEVLWRKLSRNGRRRGGKLYVRGGSFKYDPLSYAQNFDEGCLDEEEEEESYRGFASRFAALQARPQHG